MTTSARIIQGHAAPEWNEVFSRVGQAGGDDVYFSRDYSLLYGQSAGQPEVFVFEVDNEVFVLPYIIKPIESKVLDGEAFDFESAYGFGGPLATTQNQDFIIKAWTHFRDICAERRIIAGFIRFHPLLDNWVFADAATVNVVRDRQVVVISLKKDPSEVWREYAPDVRNKVRKGEKLGVSVRATTGVEALIAFSRIYEEHMEEIEAHSSYTFGEEYFRAIHQLGMGSYRVYLAEHGGDMIGGALILLSRKFAHYHLSSCASRYNKLAPNTMLRHAVIHDLLGSGRTILNFGGGRTPNPEDSLLKFKSGFSPERRQFFYGTFAVNEEIRRRLCEHWAVTHPEMADRYGGRFMSYRFE